MLDLILVGGGLANGLLAWRLLMSRPDVSFVLLEEGSTLGGNETWSFLGTDVTKAQLEWLWVLCSKSWPSHDVGLAKAPRRIGGGYHAIKSGDFHWKLTEHLQDRVRLRTKVTEVEATRVILANGEVIEARAVIDGRGLSAAPSWPCGFQRIRSLEVELDAPDGLEVPLLMDGRFGPPLLSLLPWDDRRVLVTETSYATDAALDLPELHERVRAALGQRGLRVAKVHREESAALPMPLSGDAPALTRPMIGMNAGLFHATTGSALPMAVDLADAIPSLEDLAAPALTGWLQQHVRRHWDQQRFFRRFNRMLFRGALPEERLKLFGSLYRHDEETIARFQGGTSTMGDKLAVLGRGVLSVPSGRALRAALSVSR